MKSCHFLPVLITGAVVQRKENDLGMGALEMHVSPVPEPHRGPAQESAIPGWSATTNQLPWISYSVPALGKLLSHRTELVKAGIWMQIAGDGATCSPQAWEEHFHELLRVSL